MKGRKKLSREEALAKVREIGDRLRAMRAKETLDSPFAGASFELAKLLGEMERDFMDGVGSPRSGRASANPPSVSEGER